MSSDIYLLHKVTEYRKCIVVASSTKQITHTFDEVCIQTCVRGDVVPSYLHEV